jgi:aldose 1-epimerase
MTQTGVPNSLDDPTATRIAAGLTEAVFLPEHGMLGISLRHKGVEFLRRNEELKIFAEKNRTAGIPFLFPWANRLAGFQYEVAGRGVTLSPHSPVLRYDDNGLPMHGMMWPHLAWSIVASAPDRLTARLDWSHPKCLVVFPYPCRLTMTATVDPASLMIETMLAATSDIPVPASLGFHPYLGLPDMPRQDWRVHLPPMRHLTLDARKIPTGAAKPFGGMDETLQTRDFDDGFVLLGDRATLSVSCGGQRISVDLLEGYPYTQVYAPHDKDYLAFEPMTAPANALISGTGLRLVPPGGEFRAAFRIRVGSDA